MNNNPVNKNFHRVAEYAYILLGGLKSLDEEHQQYYGTLSPEDIVLASYWVTDLPGIAELICSEWRNHPDLISPIEHLDVIKLGEFIEVKRCRDAEYSFIWRDVGVNWYKRPGRCMCASRELTEEEQVQFNEEFLAALALHQNNPSKRVPPTSFKNERG